MSDPAPGGSGAGRLRTTVNVVQWVAVAAVALFVVMLFARGPSGSVTADDGGGGGDAPPDGAVVFAERCASCHGGDGGGGSGPQLSDGRVVEEYPDVADQVAVVTGGRGGMPSFADRLSAEEIQAVVEFTRTL